MTAINRGFCYWCGERVDEMNVHFVGECKVWACEGRECQKALWHDQQDAEREHHAPEYEDYR